MKKLKKVKTTRWFKLYRDHDGKRYIKWGRSDVRRLRFWPRRRLSKWGLVLVIIVLAGWAAYYPVMQYAANKVVEQVADKLLTPEEIRNILDSPEFQEILRNQTATAPSAEPSAQPSTSPGTRAEDPAAPSSSLSAEPATRNPPQPIAKPEQPAKLRFSSNDEALKFLLTKFSMSELRSLAGKAGGGLTIQNKQEIKDIVMQKLTTEEFDALKVLAVLELQRRNGVIELK